MVSMHKCDAGRYSHLKLGVENLHVQTVLLDLLHAHSFRLGFIALLVAESLNLVGLCQALDDLGFDVSRRCFLCAVRILWSHTTNGTTLQPGRRRHESCARPIRVARSALRVHHQPLVVLFSIVLFEILGCGPVDIVLGHRSQISPSIGFHNDQISRLDGESGALLHVKNIGARALEEDNI